MVGRGSAHIAGGGGHRALEDGTTAGRRSRRFRNCLERVGSIVVSRFAIPITVVVIVSIDTVADHGLFGADGGAHIITTSPPYPRQCFRAKVRCGGANSMRKSMSLSMP